jgi:hypothetical protein
MDFGLKSSKSDRLLDMKTFNKDDLTLQGATLIGFPFKVNGFNLVDPFTGNTIPQSLLL